MKQNKNINYNEASKILGISNEIVVGTKDWYKAIQNAGYKYAYVWLTSEIDLMFFATDYLNACEGAAELYAKGKGIDIKEARKQYYEYIDVYSLDDIIAEWSI